MPLFFTIPIIKSSLLNLLFPYFCIGCGQEGEVLCAACRYRIKIVPPSCLGCGKISFSKKGIMAGRTCLACQKKCFIYAFLSPLSFDDALTRKLIHSFKYERMRFLGAVLGSAITAHALQNGFRPNSENFVIVPIPLYPGRERVRGFNQAREIAASVGEGLKIPVFSSCLFRKKKTMPQVGLSGVSRAENVAGAFLVRNGDCLRGMNVILVDDVKTTGATLNEAARVLKEAGVTRVIACTAAR